MNLEKNDSGIAKKRKQFMKLALQEAKEALTEGEVPIGAIIVKDDQVISSAHNKKQQLNDPTAHAEILAIRAAAEKLGNWRLKDCELYVTIEPCPMCLGAVCQTELKALNYGAAEPRYGALESKFSRADFGDLLPKRLEVYAGILEEDTAELMRAFFKSRRQS